MGYVEIISWSMFKFSKFVSFCSCEIVQIDWLVRVQFMFTLSIVKKTLVKIYDWVYEHSLIVTIISKANKTRVFFLFGST